MSDLHQRPSLAAGIAAFRQRWPGLQSRSREAPVFVLAAGEGSGAALLQRFLLPQCFVWRPPREESWPLDLLSMGLRRLTPTWPAAHVFHQGETAAQLRDRPSSEIAPAPDKLLEAPLRYIETLLAEPALATGAARWGLADERLSADDAEYLKWLFPRAKLLFLVRNPYDAYRAAVAQRHAEKSSHHGRPDPGWSVAFFGRRWNELVQGFLAEHERLGGMLIRYEALARGDFGAIEDYLGFSLSGQASQEHAADALSAPVRETSELELVALENEVEKRAEELGYFSPRAKQAASDPTSQDWPAGIQTSHLAADPSKCVILVPVGLPIEAACEESLRVLERRGYHVRRVRGYAAIDQGRNQMATDALRDGFEETMWIDTDIAFEPDAVERLRAHQLPIVSAIYPQKGKRMLASRVLPGTEEIIFGEQGGLLEILYAATGFLLVRREAYLEMQRQLKLPYCNERFARPTIPFFQPMVVRDGEGHWYLAEDYSFSERARQCGYRIYADTTIRLGHIGGYGYSWEDAGSDPKRYRTYRFRIPGARPT